MIRTLVTYTVVGAVLCSACGASDASGDAVTSGAPPADVVPASSEAEALVCAEPSAPIDAGEVQVVGSLTARERQLVDWALERFALASLRLPPVISASFDPSKEDCEGNFGLCRPSAEPPEFHICVDEGDEVPAEWSREEVFLLHELAHIWRRNIAADLDVQSIVGGTLDDTADVIWTQRTEERMAVVISWGLLDTEQRPRMTAVPCVDMYGQFVELTGVEPLEPIAEECRP